MTKKLYAYIHNNEIIGIGEVKCLNENTLNIEISQETFDEYAQDQEKFIFENNTLVQNPDYEKIVHDREIKARKLEILDQLNELDTKRIRAVCENEVKDETTGQTWLEYYNAQIVELRKQLAGLSE